MSNPLISLGTLGARPRDFPEIQFPAVLTVADLVSQALLHDVEWVGRLTQVTRINLTAEGVGEILMTIGDTVELRYSAASEAGNRRHRVIVHSPTDGEQDLGTHELPGSWGARSMVWQALVRYWMWRETPLARLLTTELRATIEAFLVAMAGFEGLALRPVTMKRLAERRFTVAVTVDVKLGSAAVAVRVDVDSEAERRQIAYACDTVVRGSGIPGAAVSITPYEEPRS